MDATVTHDIIMNADISFSEDMFGSPIHNGCEELFGILQELKGECFYQLFKGR